MSNDPVADELYTVAKMWIVNNEVPQASNLIAFASMLMTQAQTLVAGRNRGLYKKQLVLGILRRIVDNDIPFENDESKQQFVQLVNVLVPPAIDTLVLLSKTDALKKWWRHIRKTICCCCP